MKKIITATINILVMLIVYCTAAKAEAPNYLILQSIGEYHNSGKGKCGTGAGFLAATDHFGEDHNDVTCRTGYYSKTQDLAVSVQITQHSGSDSDKWLLHEVEDGYRDPDVLEGNWTQGARVREINGNKIFFYGGGVVGYAWLSTFIVVNIEYTNLSGPKPEPLDIVKAYLVKFPSSITLTDADAKSAAHSTTWLKDEISRRLWLADKWVAQITVGDPKLYDKLDEVVKSLGVFLNYKEKYFVQTEEEKTAGITAKSEQRALNISLENKDAESIKKKLSAYKTWWSSHKEDAISLQ